MSTTILPAAIAAPIPPRSHALSIQLAVAERYDIPLHVLLSPQRSAPIARARHIAMWIVRNSSDHSLPAIARLFRRYDHTTVIHAVRRIDAMMRRDPAFGAEMRALLLAFLPAKASA
jgi:chromosomal replication initiator protein